VQPELRYRPGLDGAEALEQLLLLRMREARAEANADRGARRGAATRNVHERVRLRPARELRLARCHRSLAAAREQQHAEGDEQTCCRSDDDADAARVHAALRSESTGDPTRDAAGCDACSVLARFAFGVWHTMTPRRVASSEGATAVFTAAWSTAAMAARSRNVQKPSDMSEGSAVRRSFGKLAISFHARVCAISSPFIDVNLVLTQALPGWKPVRIAVWIGEIAENPPLG